MKNKFKIYICIFWSSLVMVIFTGCLNLKSDEQIVTEKLMELVSALQDKNHDDIKSLFAPNIISSLDNFDDSINDLTAYYDGVYESFDEGGLITEQDRDSGIDRKWFNMSHDVTTNVDIFRIAIIWYVIDTGDTKNIGIWSLYIIKFDDDTTPEYSYRGDGWWTNGIHIGKPYARRE